MSRYTHKVDGVPDMPEAVEVSYGYDHACGFFVQVLDKDEELLLDRDSMFHNLTGVDLVEKLIDLGLAIPDMHYSSMMMDMPF